MKKYFFCILKSLKKRVGSAYPDPHQNVTDPQHWTKGSIRNRDCAIFLWITLERSRPTSLASSLERQLTFCFWARTEDAGLAVGPPVDPEPKYTHRLLNTLNIFFCYYTYGTVHSYNRSFITFAEALLQSPYLHSCRLSGWNLLGVPSRDSNSGLPYSKPEHYNLSYAAPYIWRSDKPRIQINFTGSSNLHYLCSAFKKGFLKYLVLET